MGFKNKASKDYGHINIAQDIFKIGYLFHNRYKRFATQIHADTVNSKY